jgi:hypothetical protein
MSTEGTFATADIRGDTHLVQDDAKLESGAFGVTEMFIFIE